MLKILLIIISVVMLLFTVIVTFRSIYKLKSDKATDVLEILPEQVDEYQKVQPFK